MIFTKSYKVAFDDPLKGTISEKHESFWKQQIFKELGAAVFSYCKPEQEYRVRYFMERMREDKGVTLLGRVEVVPTKEA